MSEREGVKTPSFYSIHTFFHPSLTLIYLGRESVSDVLSYEVRMEWLSEEGERYSQGWTKD